MTATERDPVFGCELAVDVNEAGYGKAGIRLAHVVAWERVNGPVPEGMELDHLCRRRACQVHLELVTRTENERRKRWSYRSARKHCAAGHALHMNRMITPERGVLCRQCHREATEKYGS